MFGFFQVVTVSAYYQGSWGTEVIGVRVCRSGKKASCAGLREGRELRG